MSFTPDYYNPERGGADDVAPISLRRDELYDLVYAAREAEIRFKRLRKCVRRGDDDVSHWSEEECNEKIAHYKAMEKWLADIYEESFGENWYY